MNSSNAMSSFHLHPVGALTLVALSPALAVGNISGRIKIRTVMIRAQAGRAQGVGARASVSCSEDWGHCLSLLRTNPLCACADTIH